MKPMEAPALTARRLFFGLGLALLLATAFALIDGRLPPGQCAENVYECTSSTEIAWLLPAATVLSLLAGLSLHLSIEKGSNSPLLAFFPNQDQSTQREKMTSDISESQDEDDLSGAWANLEEGLLTSKNDEEE